MESRILDGSQIANGEVVLQLDSYVATFVLVGRNQVARSAVSQAGRYRGTVRVPPEQCSIMLRDARAILLGAQTANATSDSGW